MDKPKMISLKEQISRDRIRLKLKQGERKGKPFHMPFIRIGNKDFGVPYHGKDTFSGMFKKFADRYIPDWEVEDEDGTKRVVQRVFVYDNNKYNADGTLKD
jgi:hypothetical protein